MQQQQNQTQQGSTRDIPLNDLDASMMTINSTWGKEISEELNEKLVKNIVRTKDGKEYVSKEYLWGLLSFYSRDLRLGNLDNTLFFHCHKWLRFASDCLKEGYIESFIVSLTEVIGVLELSQSRNGFLRKRSNTITKEEFSNSLEPKKKGLFSKPNVESGQNAYR